MFSFLRGRRSGGNNTPPPPPPPPGHPLRAWTPPPPHVPAAYSAVGSEERLYGPRPAHPLFPWQFHAETNAAKLADIRSRRAATRLDTPPAPAKAGEDPPSALPPPPPVHPASIAPADGTCLLEALPRELLLYILQDVDEETLAIDCPLVSRLLNDAAQDDHLWRHRYLVDVGRAPPPLSPPSKYANGEWHRQPANEKEEYFYKTWRWYESVGGGGRHDKRSERFTVEVHARIGRSPHANSRLALLGDIAAFDRTRLRRVYTVDRSAPRLLG